MIHVDVGEPKRLLARQIGEVLTEVDIENVAGGSGSCGCVTEVVDCGTAYDNGSACVCDRQQVMYDCDCDHMS